MARFVITNTTPPQPKKHFNRIISRTDNITPPSSNTEPRRTDPTRCPMCGMSSYTCDAQFIRIADGFKCRVCGTVINFMGVVLVNPITD